jgi:pimeloyl-ACP methyl ester carboxylesterase
MKRTFQYLGLVAFFALFTFGAETANAMFIDRFVMQWRQLRTARHDAEIVKLPLFQSNFLKYPANNVFAKDGTFTQKLNHFDPNDGRTFEQRYWVNSSYASSSDAPVIYYICGESRCSAAGGFAVTLAKELHAYVITLEHRYYGDSVPVSDYSAPNMKYLSVDQALADLDAFQTYVVREKKLTGAWLAVGGSYSGSLSAYYRLLYPNKISGALSSSGPVQAKAQFEEYDYQIATVIPESCRLTIQKVTREIEDDLRSADSRKAVKAMFESSEVQNDVDFLYIVADMAAIAIQYGSRVAFCSNLERAANPKVTYAKEGLRLFAMMGMTTIEDTAQGNMSVNANDYRENGMRQWLYQSCTEYGYWQVAFPDPKFSSRSAQINLPFHNEICTRLFGIRGTVDTNYINRKYYAPLVAGKSSRTFFTNGSDDPWKHLGISPARRNVPRSVDAALIEGASHCEDLGDPGRTSTRAAQTQFRSLVKSWLGAKGYRWTSTKLR